MDIQDIFFLYERKFNDKFRLMEGVSKHVNNVRNQGSMKCLCPMLTNVVLTLLGSSISILDFWGVVLQGS